MNPGFFLIRFGGKYLTGFISQNSGPLVLKTYGMFLTTRTLILKTNLGLIPSARITVGFEPKMFWSKLDHSV